MTAFSPPTGLLNGVGYNTVENQVEDDSYIFGASFLDMTSKTGIPFNALSCTEGFEDGEQIQTPYIDENGLTQMHLFWYYGEWLDEEYNQLEEGFGLELGAAAWFIGNSAKHITTAGEVKNGQHIHTFVEPSSLISSAFPVAFCPNSENVSWGISDGDSIQTVYTDENGLTQAHLFWYYGEWLDEEYNQVSADTAIVGAGEGFWLDLQDAESTFTEVSPIN